MSRTKEIIMEIGIYEKKISEDEAKRLNPLVLAFIGDAVYELVVRTFLMSTNTELSAHKLHVKAISFVKAQAQSEALKSIMEVLTEEEMVIYKRGRNTKSATVPKNADVQEYRTATGFEALIGFLYISEQNERLNELLRKIIK
jgi:ribonuclease III family protein